VISTISHIGCIGFRAAANSCGRRCLFCGLADGCVINTQGVFRFRDFGTTGVTFAIFGGTGRYKKAHGTVTVKNGEFTYDVR
jgi:hypothetical protein